MVCQKCKKDIDKQSVRCYPNKLYFLRTRLKASREDLATALGISHQYVLMLEVGQKTPSFHLAKRIADFFETTIDDIFFSCEDK